MAESTSLTCRLLLDEGIQSISSAEKRIILENVIIESFWQGHTHAVQNGGSPYNEAQANAFVDEYPRKLEDYLSTTDVAILIYENGRLIATSFLAKGEQPDEPIQGSKKYFFWGNYVHPDYKRRGIGTYVMEIMKFIAKYKGINLLPALAVDLPSTIDFYKSHGFEVSDPVSRTLKVNDRITGQPIEVEFPFYPITLHLS